MVQDRSGEELNPAHRRRCPSAPTCHRHTRDPNVLQPCPEGSKHVSPARHSPLTSPAGKGGCRITRSLGCSWDTQLRPRLGLRNAVQSSAWWAGRPCGTPGRSAVPRAQGSLSGVAQRELAGGRWGKEPQQSCREEGEGELLAPGTSFVRHVHPLLPRIPPALPQLFPWPQSCCSNRSRVSVHPFPGHAPGTEPGPRASLPGLPPHTSARPRGVRTSSRAPASILAPKPATSFAQCPGMVLACNTPPLTLPRVLSCTRIHFLHMCGTGGDKEQEKGRCHSARQRCPRVDRSWQQTAEDLCRKARRCPPSGCKGYTCGRPCWEHWCFQGYRPEMPQLQKMLRAEPAGPLGHISPMLWAELGLAPAGGSQPQLPSPRSAAAKLPAALQRSPALVLGATRATGPSPNTSWGPEIRR